MVDVDNAVLQAGTAGRRYNMQRVARIRANFLLEFPGRSIQKKTFCHEGKTFGTATHRSIVLCVFDETKTQTYRVCGTHQAHREGKGGGGESTGKPPTFCLLSTSMSFSCFLKADSNSSCNVTTEDETARVNQGINTTGTVSY